MALQCMPVQKVAPLKGGKEAAVKELEGALRISEMILSGARESEGRQLQSEYKLVEKDKEGVHMEESLEAHELLSRASYLPCALVVKILCMKITQGLLRIQHLPPLAPFPIASDRLPLIRLTPAWQLLPFSPC